MGRRTLLLIASILVAAVGTALIFLYVRGADDRAKVAATPVYVIVAKKDIAIGKTVGQALSSGSFEVAKFPSGLLPARVLSAQNADDLTPLNAFRESTIQISIPAKTLITPDLFAAAGEAATSNLANGLVSQSIQISDPNRVAGIVKPGVSVAVMATIPGATEKSTQAKWLMTDIKVVAVGADGLPAGAGAQAVAAQIVDLAVLPEQALQLRLNEKLGELSLVVLGPGVTIPPDGFASEPKFVPNG